ncbi:zinc finger protein [Tremella mesenterica]|uniref:Zinc finger protein n=1 Tax=Tremella mesenterica TaxID=5217 RepID=A0A4Q1BDK7_TREME|nr:zinc finger protein [Tremella mesenterica]
MTEQKENLFPTLGEVASQTAARPDRPDNIPLQEGETSLPDVDDDGDDGAMQEIDSLCMRCHEQGKTRLLLTSIPYFKEIVLSSFQCDSCGWRDTEIQSAGEIQEKGVNFTVHLLRQEDLNRQLVKSATSTVTLPDLQLTIPPGRGQLTTVEGIIRDTVRDLNMSQPLRRVMDPENAKKIDDTIEALRDLIGMPEDEDDDDGGVGRPDDEVLAVRPEVSVVEGHEKAFKPFTVTLDDPSGNSFFQFIGAANDPQWNMRAYNRTFEQNVALGLVAAPEDVEDTDEGQAGEVAIPEDHKLRNMKEFEELRDKKLADMGVNGAVMPDEVFSFPSTCSSCGHALDTRMQQVNIPYFQNIIIMATNCPACGYRDNEVKSGQAISDKGKRITLQVSDEDDLSRDLLKSDTAGLEIPEIELVLQPGTLGGRFTTLEGLLNDIYSELSTKVFRAGDSAHVGVGQQDRDDKDEKTFEQFLKGLKDCMTVARPFTLIIDDPVSNSYLQNIYAPDPDPNMTIVEYERTKEQNDDLGLSDMVLEGYEKDVDKPKTL